MVERWGARHQEEPFSQHELSLSTHFGYLQQKWWAGQSSQNQEADLLETWHSHHLIQTFCRRRSAEEASAEEVLPKRFSAEEVLFHFHQASVMYYKMHGFPSSTTVFLSRVKTGEWKDYPDLNAKESLKS